MKPRVWLQRGVLEYGIHALGRSGLSGLVVRHPNIGGDTQVQFLVRPDLESHHFCQELATRDGKQCVWTGLPPGVGMHIIPYSN